MLTQFIKKTNCRKLFIGLTLISCISLSASSTLIAQSTTNSKNSLTARLINVEATSNETFRFNSVLNNNSSTKQTYDLEAKLPEGWQILYRVDGSTVRSLQLEANSVKDISIEITCPISTKPEKYKIPVQAISSNDTLTLDLEAVVRGSYAVELMTPSGRLSDDIVAGNSKEITVVVKNTGTLPLNGLELSSQLPTKWETSFAPSNIEQIEPGKSVDVKVTLKVPEKTIAGDYLSKITVRNANSNAEASIRMVVKTSLLSGWIGIVVILAAAGLIYGLIRKYGRR